MRYLFNEKYSVRTQLGASFVAITIISIGVCLSISLGFSYALGGNSYTTAVNGIKTQTQTNANTDSKQIATAVAKQFAIIAESVCMVTSLQSELFIAQVRTETQNYALGYATEESFREYNFLPDCSYPDCPRDFGPLQRVSVDGSITHSSVYLYDSVIGPLRNDSAWNTKIGKDAYITPLMNALAYQDMSFFNLYTLGYSETVLFYLSLQIGDSTLPAGYTSIHRGYPGTLRNTTSYNPTTRPWFEAAPVDAYYLDGPYKETFTGKYVVNLSSRKPLVVNANHSARLQYPEPSVVVTGAVVDLEVLTQLIKNNVYPNQGYGVLIKYDSLRVLVWWNSSVDIYNYATSSFYTVSELDAGLGNHNLQKEGNFLYNDENGVRWLVATTPCLIVTDYRTGVTSPSLIMMIFSKWDEATSTLPALQSNIDHTTAQVLEVTVIIACAILAAVLLLAFFLVTWLTEPLSKIRDILAEIVEISAEEENKRNYGHIVEKSWFDFRRSDELGVLATSFWHMVVKLHDSNEAKKKLTKYPVNPLYMPVDMLLLQSGVVSSSSHGLAVATVATSLDGNLFAARNGSAPPAPAGKSEPPITITRKNNPLANESNAPMAAISNLPDENQIISVEHFLASFDKLQQDMAAAATALSSESVRPTVSSSLQQPSIAPRAAVVDGDVLGGLVLGTTDSAPTGLPSASLSYSQLDSVAGDTGDIEMGASVRNMSGGYSQVAPVEAVLVVNTDDRRNPATCTPIVVITLRFYLYGLSCLLILGLLAMLGSTVYFLQSEGQSWMQQTGKSIEDSEVLNLGTIAIAKSSFCKLYFKQVTIDTQVLASWYTKLLDGNLTDIPAHPEFYTEELYLPSYSLDATNYYHLYATLDAAGKSFNTSGYFEPDSADCVTSTNCLQYQNSNRTRLSSMLDLHTASYFHADSSLDFIQTGHEDVGYTRIFPYQFKSYGDPTSCLITDTTDSFCNTAYMSSLCNAANTAATAYPPYDARCRSWYQFALSSGVTTSDVFFQYPRITSAGTLVLTAAIPVHRHGDASEALYGVLSLNVLTTVLSESVNAFTILQSGYVYLIDAKNVSNVVLHPKLTTTCTAFRCCEKGFTDTEFAYFNTYILQPLQRSSSSELQETVTLTKYDKGGKSFRFAYSMVTYGTVDYILFAVVSEADILKTSTTVENDINSSNVGIIVAASFCLFFFAAIIVFVTGKLVVGVAAPVNDLIALCNRIVAGDLSSQAGSGDGGPTDTTAASSLDMQLLLAAFAQMLTALRFGSDSYARGNVVQAEIVFKEALALYTASNNSKGIGACHNNLGVVYTSMRSFDLALQHYNAAIVNAEGMLAEAIKAANEKNISAATSTASAVDANSAPHLPVAAVATAATTTTTTTTTSNVPAAHQAASSTTATQAELQLQQLKAMKRAQKVLSDRQGNLALLYMAQGAHPKAFNLLESCMETDKANGYIRGCVVKQGNMGLLYLQQGEAKSAERVFMSALNFVSTADKRFFGDNSSTNWDEQETMVAKEIALFNVAKLHEHCERFPLAMHYYLLALTGAPIMYRATSMQAFSSVLSLLSSRKVGNATNTDIIRRLGDLSTKYELVPAVNSAGASQANQGNFVPKRVAFALDYSGSMSGTKIKAAVASLADLFEHQLHPEDKLLILSFSSTCSIELPLTKKSGNEAMITDIIKGLITPSGSTALYDSICACINALEQDKTPSNNNWVVVLTDGQEGGSKLKKPHVEAMLRKTNCGFVMLGVGEDVNDVELKGLVDCCAGGKGFYVTARGNQEGIQKAFGQVAMLISGQVILEEI